MTRPIHPFPARMAPDLAIAALKRIKTGSVVLDPMAGSGTVVRQACELGHKAIGFDVDPLAVLMAQAWTTPVQDSMIGSLYSAVVEAALQAPADAIRLPWMDEDEETSTFVDYWFAEPQRTDLRRLAFGLTAVNPPQQPARAALDILKVAFSRLIITKDSGASLARDVSHSRPHKVADSSKFDVIPSFDRSVRYVRRLLLNAPPPGRARVQLGDARLLKPVTKSSVDVVLTSPPYLNAIDYMRGHRLSLVWLGYRLADLRKIRAGSIGAERGPEESTPARIVESIQGSMGEIEKLPRRHASMVSRYAKDVFEMMSEIVRVLRQDGRAILVVGNSCIRGTFIKNSEGIIRGGSEVGLKLLRKVERDLPVRSRYLPMPSALDEALGKRIRTETILTFKVA